MISTISDRYDVKFFTDISDVGIVIQGPLISRGRTGVTAQIKRHKVASQHVVNYECIENIAKLFKEFGGFGRMVCVIWSDESEDDIERLQSLVGSENVSIIDDATKNVKPKKGVLPGNNKYRQFYSSLKGTEILAEHGCEYAIKIRSDQYLNLYELAEDFLKIKAARKNFIMIPRLQSGSSTDHLADFYIGGKTNDLRTCFGTYLSSPELYRNVHTDIFYSWASIMLGRPKYPPRVLGVKTNRRYIARAWNTLYCPASFSVLSALLWRGESIAINRQKTKFIEDLPSGLKISNAMLK